MKILALNRRLTFGLILLFGLLAMTARNALDPDLWWHLRTGELIVETGHVPHVDPFSFTRAGHAWVSHEWLSEVAFYEILKHGGAVALIVFASFVTTAGFMLLYLRCPGKAYWAAAATALGAFAAAPSWGVRPQMFTFTLASLLLWLIERGEKRPRSLLWIPPLFLLWLNLHAGFALGIVLLTAYALGIICESALGQTPWPQARPILLKIVAVLVTCLALVPLNPSGSELYRYPLDTLRSHGMRSLIGEWFSPDFHQWLYRPLLLVWLLLVAALALSNSRPKARVLLPLILTAFAALDAVRHIPIFILVAMPVIAAALASASEPLAEPPIRTGSNRRTVFVGSVVVLLAMLAVVKWVTLTRNQEARESEQFPEKAVAFLQSTVGQSAGGPQNVFVYYDWGGYAIWKLYPGSRVFVDGRADLYVRDNDLSENVRDNVRDHAGNRSDNDNADPLQQFQTAVRLQVGWRDVLDRWNVSAVLIPPSTALAQALLLDSGWRREFADSQAVLFVRNTAAVKDASIFKKTATLGPPSENE
ncbi:MAG TPA: hypothetical protein VKR59_20315 [Terriglobales bacterium]|nr:hypothetical protein [Terriglobales bacterium]